MLFFSIAPWLQDKLTDIWRAVQHALSLHHINPSGELVWFEIGHLIPDLDRLHDLRRELGIDIMSSCVLSGFAAAKAPPSTIAARNAATSYRCDAAQLRLLVYMTNGFPAGMLGLRVGLADRGVLATRLAARLHSFGARLHGNWASQLIDLWEFLHNDPIDRPPEKYNGEHTVHTGGGRECWLQLPMIQQR